MEMMHGSRGVKLEELPSYRSLRLWEKKNGNSNFFVCQEPPRGVHKRRIHPWTQKSTPSRFLLSTTFIFYSQFFSEIFWHWWWPIINYRDNAQARHVFVDSMTSTSSRYRRIISHGLLLIARPQHVTIKLKYPRGFRTYIMHIIVVVTL